MNQLNLDKCTKIMKQNQDGQVEEDSTDIATFISTAT